MFYLDSWVDVASVKLPVLFLPLTEGEFPKSNLTLIAVLLVTQILFRITILNTFREIIYRQNEKEKVLPDSFDMCNKLIIVRILFNS